MREHCSTPRPGIAMSYQACTQVWEHSKAKGSNRLTLLAIADCAQHDGRGAHPSIATLAQKTLLTQRQVINIIKDLETSGELSVERPKARRLGLANSYTLHVGSLNRLPAKISRETGFREKTAAMGEAGFTTTVLIQRSEVNSTGVEAEELWAAALAQLRGLMTASNYTTYIEGSAGLRLDGGELVVQARPDQVEALTGRFRPLVERALPGRAVRFERG